MEESIGDEAQEIAAAFCPGGRGPSAQRADDKGRQCFIGFDEISFTAVDEKNLSVCPCNDLGPEITQARTNDRLMAMIG